MGGASTIFFFSLSSSSNFFISSSLKSPKQNYHNHHQASTKDLSLSISKSTTDPIIISPQQQPNIAPIKAPTAPWMKSPLLVQPHKVLDLSQQPTVKKGQNKDQKAKQKTDKALFGKESGVRGKKVMKKIIRSFERLRPNGDFGDTHVKNCEKVEVFRRFEDKKLRKSEEFGVLRMIGKRSGVEKLGPKEDFGDTQVKKREKVEFFRRSEDKQLRKNEEFGVLRKIGGRSGIKKFRPKGDFGATQVKNRQKVEFFSRFEDKKLIKSEEFEVLCKIGESGGDGDEEKIGGKRMPWTREERIVIGRVRKEKVVTTAESKLDKVLLERLRGEAKVMRTWVKVMKAGVIQRVVDEIKFCWRKNELAMVKFDLPLCRNMDRAREIIEMKTGGLVVWSYKDTLVVYRGLNKPSTVKRSFPAKQTWYADGQEPHSSETSSVKVNKNISQTKSSVSVVDETMDEEEVSVAVDSFEEENWKDQPVNGSLFERETDRLLDGLGPRYIDWWMSKPLPVDADLLPERVPGFRTPFRLCPPNTRPKLKDEELTQLREVAQGLPTHFVLGRNRYLQGLAAAIIKLWEKCPIAKISVKWGVLNTNNEQMANELKSLTGGVLLLRNKFYIILFRGKDFLPCQVADLITEREIKLRSYQLNEENARHPATETYEMTGPQTITSTSGTLSEFQDFRAGFGDVEQENVEFEIQREAEKEKLKRELRKQEHKLCLLNRKIEISAKELSKLKSKSTASEEDFDQEMFTEEERECLRKIGQKMNSVLVLGRRGVYHGVLEGLHQHWKFREVVKVITMQRVFARVIYTAKLLEAESGGILVSVEQLKEGHAIILYRGKNYKRPSNLSNLLTKREALHRSIELQRIGSIKFIAYQRRRAISELKLKLAQLQESGKESIKSEIVQTEL